MFNDYRDSLPTVEKSAHAAILNRHDTTERALALISAQGESIIARLDHIRAQVEVVRAHAKQTRLARFLAWLGLI